MKPSTKYLKITVNIVSMALIFAFCIWILPKLIVYFMPFVIAGIIALIANPLVRFLEQKLKIVRKAGTVFVIVLVLGLVVFLCYIIIAKLVTETIGFFQNAPQLWKVIADTAASLRDDMLVLFKRMPDGMQDWLDGVGESATLYMTNSLSDFGETIGTAASKTASNLPLLIVQIIMGVLASYLFVAEHDYLQGLYRKIVPEPIRNRMELVMSTMKTAVGGYFKAQLKIMVFVYAALLIGFVVLDVDYAFLIALLIAILDFLPFFGTGAAMWPWALVVAISGDYMRAVWIMVIWGISQLVRQLIQPKMVGDSVGLEPIPTIFFLYIGFRVGSAIGLILAVPIGMIVINLYKAGVFRNFVYSIQLLLKDISKLRRFEKSELIYEGILPKDAEADEDAGDAMPAQETAGEPAQAEDAKKDQAPAENKKTRRNKGR